MYKIVFFLIFAAQIFAAEAFKYFPLEPLLFNNFSTYDELFGKEIKKAQNEAVGTFKQKLKEKFPTTIQSLGKYSLDDTIFVAAYISRISRNTVEGARLNQNTFKQSHILSVTGGIQFVNIVSGEVYYSTVYTHQSIIETAGEPTPAEKTKMQQEYKNLIISLISHLIDESANEFKPHTISAKKIGSHEELLILSGGKNIGLSEGETLKSSDGLVCKAETVQDKFLLCRPLADKQADKIKDGTLFSKTSNTTGKLADKPRVMVAKVWAAPDKIAFGAKELDAAQLSDWLYDQMGKSGQFLMLPHQDSFDAHQYNAAASGDVAKSEVMKGKALPDYYLRLLIPRANVETYPTHIKNAYRWHFELEAIVQLIDRRGQIVYSAQHTEKQDEDVERGVRVVNVPKTFQTMAKNSLVELGQKVSTSFKIHPFVSTVEEATPDAAFLNDPSGGLVVGATPYDVFRKNGTVKDGGAELGGLMIKTGRVKILSRNGDKVTAKLLFGDIATGDSITLQSFGVQSPKKAVSLIASDIRSQNNFSSDINLLSEAMLASVLEAPVYISDKNLLEKMVMATSDAKGFGGLDKKAQKAREGELAEFGKTSIAATVVLHEQPVKIEPNEEMFKAIVPLTCGLIVKSDAGEEIFRKGSKNSSDVDVFRNDTASYRVLNTKYRLFVEQLKGLVEAFNGASKK